MRPRLPVCIENGAPMQIERRTLRDPRTLARDVPGIFEALFPQLVPGVVAHFNRSGRSINGCNSVPEEVIASSSLQHAMLFELSVAAAEQLLRGAQQINWDASLALAISRQRRYFDAQLPDVLTEQDTHVAALVAANLVLILREIEAAKGGSLVHEPLIPGYQWIASGKGDFATGDCILEVKCTARRFSTSDYRQIVMYWLLSYASSIQTVSQEWGSAVLVNPRLNYVTEFSFEEILAVISGGRSKVDLVDQLSALIAKEEI